MVLLEALTGRQPFQGLDLKQQLYRVASGQVEVPEGLPEHWQILFRGLLTTDYTQRWRKKEIDAWLKNASSRAPGSSAEGLQHDAPSKTPVSPVRQRVELERLPESRELTTEELLEFVVWGGLRPLFRFFWVAFVVGGMTRSSVLAALILVLLVAVGVALQFRPSEMERFKRENRVENELRSLSRKKRRKIRRIVREWIHGTDRPNT